MNELIGISRGLTADGRLDQSEAEFLQRWLAANSLATNNPVAATLFKRVNDHLADDALDKDEASELLDTLNRFSGGNFELGEMLRSTSLPFDRPMPKVVFEAQDYCFTGTFAFGTRRDCKAQIERLGGSSGRMTSSTDYLVVGIYATESWAHSSYGRKIETAVDYRSRGGKVKIISEKHWVDAMEEARALN